MQCTETPKSQCKIFVVKMDGNQKRDTYLYSQGISSRRYFLGSTTRAGCGVQFSVQWRDMWGEWTGVFTSGPGSVWVERPARQDMTTNTSLLHSLHTQYNYVFNDLRDPRYHSGENRYLEQQHWDSGPKQHDYQKQLHSGYIERFCDYFSTFILLFLLRTSQDM